MPKMKTHKGAAKRFKVTGSGKIMTKKPHGKMTRKVVSKPDQKPA